MAEVDGERIKVVALVGDQSRRSRSARLAGGWLVSVLGDIELDLREAQIVGQAAKVRVVCLFGETEFVVPPGWTTRIGHAMLLTDIEDRTAPPAPGAAAAAPRLDVGGFALLGDFVVKSER